MAGNLNVAAVDHGEVSFSKMKLKVNYLKVYFEYMLVRLVLPRKPSSLAVTKVKFNLQNL